ncbi:MAG: biotin--[acetyl-CoA-carboxylase] ligase [Erythrobacter sp.]|nr:biotin--[acetyl-CoA-carboxylase] ligase [Erythrobacter sp.]
MIKFIDETGSTNADLARRIAEHDPPADGDWLVARRQLAGRGRQGREWFDGSGNFMGSTIIRLREGDPPPATLGFPAALAVHDVVSEALDAPERAQVKWPNDVLLDGGKLAGLLLERHGQFVIVGIGVNLARAPDIPGRRTAALADHVQSMPLERFAEHLARRLAVQLTAWRENGLAPTLALFTQHASHQSGAHLTVHDADGSRIGGTFAGVDPSDGALRLRLADGSERVIRAGDVD